MRFFLNEELCLHASEMEKRAAEMERESVKYKQAEYLQDQIGKQSHDLDAWYEVRD